jgi:hypothetical protein
MAPVYSTKKAANHGDHGDSIISIAIIPLRSLMIAFNNYNLYFNCSIAKRTLFPPTITTFEGRLQRESGYFKIFWMPDQVRHDE